MHQSIASDTTGQLPSSDTAIVAGTLTSEERCPPISRLCRKVGPITYVLAFVKMWKTLNAARFREDRWIESS
ncbi:hypothetical protein EG68_06140 [Paragonimus skrjabini miyazakii]|uniref:Uncharacterized protein n=1 Tax=Paragonimus skrjabini miyazakii TaxID=59628 RepID=A0A8S9Z1I4_9TREM|nr:hypothetical protein EG68_06140 [Paragonimus skrjabini miyazakii]